MRLILGLLIFLALLPVAASESSKREGGDQLKVEVVWAAPTNTWPGHLWIYKARPHPFSEAVVSNLLTIASFRWADRTKAPAYLLEADKNALFFGNLEGACKHLAICPGLGYIEYFNPKAEATSQLQSIHGVPDQVETTRLGLRYLRFLGIDVSQLATKPGTDELDLHWERERISYTDPGTKTEVSQTNNFGVFFRRRIDGINTSGIGLRGGAEFVFGNDAEPVKITVSWRGLEPHELRRCASPEQIVAWLRAGRIPLPAQAGPVSEIRKLTIIQASPYYDTNPGDEPQNLVFPKLDVVATVDKKGGATSVQIVSQIIVEEAAHR